MRKGILVLFLAIAAFSAAAQEKVVHRNIGLDSLMVILQRSTVEKVYYQSDESAKNLAFTVDQGRAGYVEQMKKDLEDNGYKILPLRGYLFVLKGVGLAQELPWDYFAVARKQEKAPVSQDYIDALSGSANVATSQNKTYQIGNRGNGSASGKA